MNQVRPSKDVIFDMIEEYIDTMNRLSTTVDAG
jgi:hypothetical protein